MWPPAWFLRVVLPRSAAPEGREETCWRPKAVNAKRLHDDVSVSSGGSGKAEGFADGEWANHRQSFDRLRRVAALADATPPLKAWEVCD